MDSESNNNTAELKENAFLSDLDKLVTNDNLTDDQVRHMYEKHAAEYEKQMHDISFKAANLGAKYFDKHGKRFQLKHDCKILDVGAGTGKVGEVLRHVYGYTTVDAIDPSDAMLSKAKEKKVYRNIFIGKVGDGNNIPVEDDKYDGVIAAGCLLPGHMPVNAFLEIIRVVKPGGIVVNVMREEFTWQSSHCDVRRPFAQWQLEDKWDIVEWAIPESKYYSDKDALVHVYRIRSKQQQQQQQQQQDDIPNCQKTTNRPSTLPKA